MKDQSVLVQINELEMNYHPRKVQLNQALHPFSLNIYHGENFALVGESGSGKSTIAKIILKLIKPTAGEVFYNNKNILDLNSYRETLAYRKDVQMVFQDPAGSLNPRMKVVNIIGDALKIHQIVAKNEIQAEVSRLLRQVGLDPSFTSHYPRELSGGQCQRVGIARALALQPKFIVADEALSALDVSIQAQILNLLKELKTKYQLTYLFIAHDLAMVKYISDRVGVMHQGRLLEVAETKEIFRKPLHPYTQALFAAIPNANPLVAIKKSVPAYTPPLLTATTKQNYALRPINNGHFVYCTAEEALSFQKEDL